MGTRPGPLCCLQQTVSTLLLCAIGSHCHRALVFAAPQAESLDKAAFLDEFATAAAALQLFSGVVQLTSKDNTFSKAYGSEAMESARPLQKDAIMPIGSNTKLFTAVAIHQLIDLGVISWEDPISKHMRPRDFKQAEVYCGRVHSDASHEHDRPGACQTPTIRQLIGMSSGIIDIVACPRDAWEAEDGNCFQTNQYQQPFNVTDLRRLTNGEFPPAFWLLVAGTYIAPLRFAPGSQFDYSNTNFILAAYIVEAASGLPFAEYVTRHILKPAGLQQTVYDLSFGFKGVVPGTLPGSGYTVRFGTSDAALAMQSTGQHKSNDLTLLVEESARRALMLSGEGSAAGGAGAMQSSAADLTKWYHLILTHPEKVNLSEAAVERILAPTTHIHKNTWYGQGVFVMLAAGYPYNVSFMYHPGVIWGYRSLMAMRLDRQDISQSQSLAVLANRAVETEPPATPGQLCRVADSAQRIGLIVSCDDIQSFLLAEMLQLGLGSPPEETLPGLGDLQHVVAAHWSS